MMNGGLANQTFQYIFARYCELLYPEEDIYIDDSAFFGNVEHNGYELEKVFGIKTKRLSEYFDEDVWEYILKELENGKSIPAILKDIIPDLLVVAETELPYNYAGEVAMVLPNSYEPNICDYNGNVYYYGYWINKDWFDKFKDCFMKELSFPQISDKKNQEYLHRIQSVNSLSLHVRRGDFVKYNWAYGTEAYKKMVDCFLENSTGDWEIFVFSDDIPWCKENQEEMGLNAFAKVHYIEGNIKGKNYIDMQLMSQCKAMIISNSSFSYLAALLNKNRGLTINPTLHRKV